ncbi:MAG TPA: TspO/MBR family protein, partial [Paracoccaceae bacterium]|nr:TspO/MBR family protein [Paracoccaceae bacterium]
RPLAIVAFVLQLALNLAWSPIFFAQHNIELALAVLLALDVAVIVTIWLAWRVRRAAAWLLVPYLLWCLFATLLNWQILDLNPDASAMDPNNAVQRIEL